MFEDLLDNIERFVNEHKGKTSEDMKEMFLDEDGNPKVELFGNFTARIKEELSAIKTSYEPKDYSDLSKFSDDELYDCLPELLFGDEEMNEKKKIAHIAYEFDMEFCNGGVSQYFANTRGEHTHELVNAFESIGAIKYAKACGDFIKKYNIKPSDFDDNIKNYFEIAETMYPYDQLEDAIGGFCITDLLQDYIIKYVRENANQIV